MPCDTKKGGVTVQIGGVVLFGAQRLAINQRIHSGEIGHGADKEFAICEDRYKTSSMQQPNGGWKFLIKLPTSTAVLLCDGSYGLTPCPLTCFSTTYSESCKQRQA